MLGEMFGTVLQGAVICLGVPFLLKLCLNLFGSSIIGFFMPHIWKCAVSDKVPPEKEPEDQVETKHVLRTDIVGCIKLEGDNTSLAALIRGYCGLVSDQTCDTQYMLKGSSRDITKTEKLQIENSVSLLLHSAKNLRLGTMTLFPYNKLQRLYHHFKQDSVISAEMREKYYWKFKSTSCCILEDRPLENCEIMIEKDFMVHEFEKHPSQREVSDMNGLVSVRDCVYNQKGQLVCMFICFDTVYSDSSSEVSSSSSYCDPWDSDCDSEEFIVFDGSCTDTCKNDHYGSLGFVCEEGDMFQETCTPLLPLNSNLYCEVSLMKSFDSKLDSFVQEILHPNFCHSYDEHIVDRNSHKHAQHESNKDLTSTDSSSKTIPKRKLKKKVHFKPDNELTTVHPMFVWNFAYKQARKGTWEADALDRLRFQKRVKELDQILTPVLLAKWKKAVEP
ncbi:unnamed protein product [Porites lobata]|uniref:Protein phosphatase 1 regulatory subunit 15A/B C-terminal domain-containing protein n=1 Tax=Porites lobata TaxID=104759 RepID=A0ABN8S1J3_9CNID|nr:unnamed protein product [Porites lobata]